MGGTHTMHSTGIFDISKKKNNEYFGGDSTVTQAGEKKIFLIYSYKEHSLAATNREQRLTSFPEEHSLGPMRNCHH